MGVISWALRGPQGEALANLQGGPSLSPRGPHDNGGGVCVGGASAAAAAVVAIVVVVFVVVAAAAFVVLVVVVLVIVVVVVFVVIFVDYDIFVCLLLSLVVFRFIIMYNAHLFASTCGVYYYII